ncbi:prepilin-type N-terminal cleavage/methylation domain-containing protein [Lysinibacillus endophyticus]
MFKEMKKRIKNQKGLTLIELLAVVVILGIIAAIAIPSIGNIIDNSRIKAVKADAANVINAVNIYRLDNGKLPANLDDLKPAYLESSGSITAITAVGLDTVTKEIKITGEATINNKTFELVDVKLSTLKIDSPDIEGETGINEKTSTTTPSPGTTT